jgi:hypothetical protein
MAEVNCVPRSEVSCPGTPYLEIEPVMRVAAGRGPMMSAWMWVKRLAGMVMG